MTYAQISAKQFAILEHLVRDLTCDANAKQVILDRIKTTMEYHQDIITELETIGYYNGNTAG